MFSLILKFLTQYILKLAANSGTHFWGTLRNEDPKSEYLTAVDQGGYPDCKLLNWKTSVVLGRPSGKEKKKNTSSSSHPTHFCEGIWFVFFEVLKDLETLFFIIVLDWEFPLIPLCVFQQNSSCLHKLRIWPLVSNRTKEDSSTMRQIVLTGFLAA